MVKCASISSVTCCHIDRQRFLIGICTLLLCNLSSLCVACIRLRCNQIKQGECGYVSEARQACWSKERCGGLGFLQTSGYSVATQLFSRRLPYIRDQFIVRDGHDEKERFKVFRCSAGGCNNNLGKLRFFP